MFYSAQIVGRHRVSAQGVTQEARGKGVTQKVPGQVEEPEAWEGCEDVADRVPVHNQVVGEVELPDVAGLVSVQLPQGLCVVIRIN